MKKLFTLVALLAMFLGANAQGGKWVQVYTIDYTTLQSFPFYVMAYAPTCDGTAMVDAPTTQKLWRGNENDFPGEEACGGTVTVNGTEFKVQETGTNQWRQYFIADNIPTKLDGKYKVVAQVKASASASIDINMGWGWGNGEKVTASVAIPEASDFQEVEWEYSNIQGTSCNLVAQPGSLEATIDWQSLVVYEWQRDNQRVPEWLEDITNGDAETAWTDEEAAIKYDDMDNNFKICAWSKEKGRNLNADGGSDPFPANIEVDPDDPNNHVFVCHGQPATTEGDAAAWDNQFWIQSKHAWKAGTTLKIKFRYKCSQASVTTNTQIHKQKPSDYLIWHAINDVTFTDQWQTFEGTMTMGDDMAGGWSIAFNLNAKVKDAVDFYFDDLSWKYLKLDEGYFVSGINATTTKSYDNLDNAIQFTVDDESGYLVATVGEKGNANSYVDQVMISTTRGDDQAFKGATLKPTSKIKSSDRGTDDEIWLEYVASNNAKLDLPGLGVWNIYIDLNYTSMLFDQIEGDPYVKDPVEVFTYTDEIVVNGKEREDLKDSWDANKQELTVREEADNNTAEDSHGAGGEGHNGETWDNQFFIKANRALEKGTVTKLVFKYKSSVAEAKTTTQCHGENPGDYKHYAAIGDVTFTDEWQDFEQEFTVPEQADGMWNIAFNMAEIKEACVYEIKDVQWYLVDAELDEGLTYENLISGGVNFFIKEGADSKPTQVGTDGISNVVTKKATSNVTYNLAGQRVSKDFKGIVIKNGQKFMNK